MDTLLETVCLPRRRHKQGTPPRGLSPFVQELHSFAQSRPRAYPRTGDRKTARGDLLRTLSGRRGHPHHKRAVVPRMRSILHRPAGAAERSSMIGWLNKMIMRNNLRRMEGSGSTIYLLFA